MRRLPICLLGAFLLDLLVGYRLNAQETSDGPRRLPERFGRSCGARSMLFQSMKPEATGATAQEF